MRAGSRNSDTEAPRQRSQLFLQQRLWNAKTAFQIQPPLVCVSLLSYLSIHCKKVMVVSTLSGLSQLHLFRGFHSTPHHAVLSGLKWPLHFLSWLPQLHLFRGFRSSPIMQCIRSEVYVVAHIMQLALSWLKSPLHFKSTETRLL